MKKKNAEFANHKVSEGTKCSFGESLWEMALPVVAENAEVLFFALCQGHPFGIGVSIALFAFIFFLNKIFLFIEELKGQ